MIQGRNILIYEGDVVIAAAKSCTINNNAEALENSSPASGTARSYTVGRTGWDISISTLVLGMKDHLLKVGQAYRLVWKVRGNDSDAMQGTAICTNAQVEATVGNLAQGSFQFLGSDDNGTIVTPPTPTPSDYVTEQDVVNIINQYDFTTEQWVQNYAGIANGMITIGHNSISPVTSVAMTVPTGFSVSGSPISKTGTLALAYATGYEGFTTALKEKIEALYSWFEVDADGDVKTKDTAGGHVRGLYSESFVSSLGKNSSSGGGGVDLTAVWASLTNTDSPTYSETLKININHIPNIGWSKIDNKPTTLAGYGITDAKIASGTITLGSNTITPLTASSSLAWGKLTGTPTTLAGYGIGDAKIANGVITLGSSTITPVTSVAMTVPTGFSVSGSPISKTGTLALAYATGYEGFTTALKEKIEALYSWFEVDAAGDIKTKDMPNGTHRGFYTESFVSALGANSQGGGSSTFDEPQMWTALQSTTGTYATTKIATSHIPDMASTYGYLKSSALNGYATQSWVNQQGFLTTHQSIYALTLKAGGTAVTTFTPNSADASLDFVAGTNISLTRGTNQITIANTYSYTLPLAASGTRGGVQIGYLESNSGTSTTRNYAVKLSSEKMYVNVPWTDTTYKLTLNGTTNGASGGTSLGSFYAPTASGTANQVLISGGSNTAPSWTAQSNLSVGTAAKLNTGTTTYTAWGQTYWSSGVPQSISGNMTSVGSITPSANGNALGTTSARFNIFGYAGNFSGNVSITGTLGVTGATTLTGLLTANGNIKTGTSNGAYIQIGAIKLVYDSTNNALKVIKSDDSSANFYATGAVSALGANSSGGGSGTFDEEAMWEALGTTSTAKVIASSHIPNLSASKITSGTLADARIPSLAASKITSGTFDTARIPNLDASKITSGTLAAARIPDLSGRYYALYGGTPLTGTSSSHYDLNTLTDVGSYYCTSNAIAQYFDNKPTNDNWAFRVWVSATIGTSSTYVRQRFQYYSGVAAYERYSIDSGSTWTGWFLIQASLANYALASSLNNYLPLSGGTLQKSSGDTPLYIKSTNTYGAYIGYQLSDGTTMGYIGVNATYGASYIKSGTVYPILRSDNYSSYALPLTGGTLTGALAVGGALYTNGFAHMIKFDVDTSRALAYGWWDTNSNTVASIVYHNTAQNIILNPIGSASVYSDAVGKYSLIVGNNKLTYNTYTILHSNNTYVSSGTGYINGNAITQTARNTYIYNSYGYDASTTVTVNDLAASSQSAVGMIYAATDNPTGGAGWCHVWSQAWNKGVNTSWISQIAIGTGNSTGMYYRTNGSSTIVGKAWTRVLDSSNYNSYSPSLTGTGASGTWGISVTGNAATATTLATPRTIWGQSFNGSADISGALTNVTGITMTSNLFLATNSEGIYLNGSGIYWHNASNAWTKSIIAFNSSGLVTVYNNLTAGGEVTASSDERKKDIISNTKFNVKDIASARSVLFEWNDGRDDDMEKKIHGGSIAQDWLGKADSFLSQDNDGWYSINYGALALCSAITIAREVVKHEDEITRLKKVVAKQAEEIVDLKNKVREFEERRVA